MQSNIKVIKSGSHYEVWKVELPYNYKDTDHDLLYPPDLSADVIKLINKHDRKDEYRKLNAWRSKNKVRRLINTNFESNDDTKFLTLTFAEAITDVDRAYALFYNFIRKLRRVYPEAQYVGVVEMQKRGVPHFHIVLSLPYIHHSVLSRWWGHGFIFIKTVTTSSGIGAYISKYLGKESFDARLDGHRKIFYSKGLRRPTVYYGEIAERLVENLSRLIPEHSYTYEYDSIYLGRVIYTEYTYKGGDKNDNWQSELYRCFL